MKITISKAGTLNVNGVWKECPLGNPVLHPCGDWCPHFGEPQVGKAIWYLRPFGMSDRDFEKALAGKPAKDPDSIALCHGTVLVGEITDEREKS